MYEKCLDCRDLGTQCGGPNLLSMDIASLREWIRHWKTIRHLTSAKLAEDSGVPKGTVDRFLSDMTVDFKYTTVHQICKPVTGGTGALDPCPATSAEIFEKVEELTQALEKKSQDVDRMRDALNRINQEHLESLQHAEEDRAKQEGYLKELLEDQKHTIRGNRKVILAMGITLFFTLSIIIFALIVDRLNPNIGFFWVH